MMPNIIYIVGFMGSGKSTVGQLLAERIGYQWLDTDAMIIQDAAGMSINEIFEQKGVAHFRQLEKKILKKVSRMKHCVVSTGGGLPCHEDNMDIIQQSGYSIFLALSVDKILTRIGQDNERPLVRSLSTQALRQLYKDRKQYYERAALKISAFGLPDVLVQRILKKMQSSDIKG